VCDKNLKKSAFKLSLNCDRWNSWFNQETMGSRHEGQTDDQGLVFFNLEPDQLVRVQVAAAGYNAFEDLINVKSNVTYFVEANMCQDVSCSEGRGPFLTSPQGRSCPQGVHFVPWR
jgi:hypothetical protein